MTKIDIFSGFLGAGKTTLIKKLLKEAYKGEQVVLIENEFGEIGIDGGFLKEAGIEIREMNSGCICCSLVGDFGEALKEVIQKYEPDRIIIEPSGVGKLSDVIKAVKKVEGEVDIKLNSFTTLVDVMKCKMYMKNFGEFFSNQIEYAGTIILSRTDKAAEEKVIAALQIIHRVISRLQLSRHRLKNYPGQKFWIPWKITVLWKKSFSKRKYARYAADTMSIIMKRNAVMSITMERNAVMSITMERNAVMSITMERNAVMSITMERNVIMTITMERNAVMTITTERNAAMSITMKRNVITTTTTPNPAAAVTPMATMTMTIITITQTKFSPAGDARQPKLTQKKKSMLSWKHCQTMRNTA